MNTGAKTEVVLDTYVLVSAALSDGKPYKILSLIENGDIVSITSPPIIAEVEDVLTRDRLPFTDKRVEELVLKIISISRVIQPEIKLNVIDDDPDGRQNHRMCRRRKRRLYDLR